MSMSNTFQARLFFRLPAIVKHFGTPFHIYDEAGICQGIQELKNAFHNIKGFNNFYAVKANRNPAVLALMQQAGFGFDCSSENELYLARAAGATPDKIMFTSNNTSAREFEVAAADGGCILNLDDTCLLDKVPKFPELICFRYNPGPLRNLTSVIGTPELCKYGVPHDQIVKVYRRAIRLGAKRFGIHTMVISNELNYQCMVETVRMLLNVCEMISAELKIKFEFINMGGGLGIPYKPGDIPIDLDQMDDGIAQAMADFQLKNGYTPNLFMESGRWVTGPHGALVTTCINRMSKYREFRGLDTSCTSSVMRPAMYYPNGGYHEIIVPEKDGETKEIVSVVGSVCEDIDRFCWERELSVINEGNIVVITNTGAHSIEMRTHYNSRYAPQVLMLGENGKVRRIARAETMADHNATFTFEPEEISL